MTLAWSVIRPQSIVAAETQKGRVKDPALEAA